LAVATAALAYYALLCAKSHTWIFVSADSADWLTTSKLWIVPQPYGSPLFTLLMKMFYPLDGEVCAIAATLVMSCLPSAITVATTYNITLLHTNNRKLAYISALILVGAGVFLTQSTVLEEYALTTMFLTLGLYYRKVNKTRLAWTMWGLGTAVHIFVVPIAAFVALYDRKHKRVDKRSLACYAITGLLPYIMVPILMALPTPRWYAGELSLHNLKEYLTSTGSAIVGTLSIFEAPFRVLTLAKIILASFGVSLILLTHILRCKGFRTETIIIAVVLWYVLTCLDVCSWTFLTLAAPIVAYVSATSLEHKPLDKYVTACAVVLIVVNAFFLNAWVLSSASPTPREVTSELKSLPDGATVAVTSGPYSMESYYVVSCGKRLTVLSCPTPYELTDVLDEIEPYNTYYVGENTDVLASHLQLDQIGKHTYLITGKSYESMPKQSWSWSDKVDEIVRGYR